MKLARLTQTGMAPRLAGVTLECECCFRKTLRKDLGQPENVTQLVASLPNTHNALLTPEC